MGFVVVYTKWIVELIITTAGATYLTDICKIKLMPLHKSIVTHIGYIHKLLINRYVSWSIKLIITAALAPKLIYRA